MLLFYSGHATVSVSWHSSRRRLDGAARQLQLSAIDDRHTDTSILSRPAPINFTLSPRRNRPEQQTASVRETLNVFVSK